MPTPGYVFRDGGPIPDDELTAQQRQQGQVQAGGTHASATAHDDSTPANTSAPISTGKLGSLSSGPTDSHALAAADHEHKGASQQEHFGAEVKDLGWDVDAHHVPKPLVGGLSNEDVWLLVRRFNKQTYHVKNMRTKPLAGLDMNIADEDDFSPDKLRANVERLYMTVIVGLISFGKHIARLRSWREPRRTVGFLAVYSIAWIFDFIVPLIFTTLTVLILVPQSRDFMFPPAPIALISSKTGGIQSPQAGVLGSHDSVTGAPEKHRGEAVEQEASNFVAGIGTIAMSSATGKHDQGDPDSDPLGGSAPDPTDLAARGADAKASASGSKPNATHDKTKQPMEDAMWTKMRPTMHVIGDVADGWERFANALSPTAPFSQTVPKLRLASVVAPMIAISMATSSYVFTKINWAVVGFGFFGDPLIWRGLELLNREFPNWQKLLEIRNSILKGVPTNAQLTVTLLRIGEAHRAPLPPPPRSDAPPEDEPAHLDKDGLSLDASHDEIHDAITADAEVERAEDTGSVKSKKKGGAKVLSALKNTVFAGVETKLGAENVKAKIGSTHAKEHLGAVPKANEQITSGPVDFKARYDGTKGWVYINTSATIPCVSFSKHQTDGTGEQTDKRLQPVFSIPIDEIAEIKKIGGFGWKTKLVIGWATEKNILDGLEIIDKKGTKTKVTAIVLRDELFNRLVAMGRQKWESW